MAMFCRGSAGALGTAESVGRGIDWVECCSLQRESTRGLGRPDRAVCRRDRRAIFGSGATWSARRTASTRITCSRRTGAAVRSRRRRLSSCAVCFTAASCRRCPISTTAVCATPTRWMRRGATRRDAELIAHARELASKLRAKRLHIRSLTQMQPPFEVSTEKVAQHLALVADGRRADAPAAVGAPQPAQANRKAGARRRGQRPDRAGGAGRFLRDLFGEHARSRIADAWPPVLQQSGQPISRSAFADSRSQQRPRGRGRTRDEFPRLDDAAVVGRDFRRRVRCTPPTRCTGERYSSASSPVAILSISGDRHSASGIFEFKRQWGPTPVQPYWSTLYLSPRASAPRQRKSLQTISRLWRYLPLGVARTVGPGLRRGISN